MDFWSGPPRPGSNWFRLRTATISLDWANRSFSIGQDKPLISPYQPDSLAEVGVPPLAGSGNLWYWLPQARYEERLHLGTNSGIKLDAALMQAGGNAYQPLGGPTNYVQAVKPAVEGRVAYWRRFDDTRKFEIAPGFHYSPIHIARNAVNSQIGSLDWLIVPSSRFTITGSVFLGQNVAGLGSLGNGVASSIAYYSVLHPIHSSGGWTQFAFPLTNKLTLNIFGGWEDDGRDGVAANSLVHDWTYASNILYHLGPNLVVGLEALQLRTTEASGLTGVQNHYDLAFGYLF